MDKSYWFRLGVIGAMFVASVYVLLPTILQEDAQSRFAEKASQAVTSGPAVVPVYVVDVAFTGDPDVALTRLRTRLDARDVATSRVSVDGDKLRVSLEVGASRDEVVAAVAGTSKLALHRFDEVAAATRIGSDETIPSGALPSALPTAIAAAMDDHGVTWGQLQSLGGTEAPPDLAPLAATVTDFVPADLSAAPLTAEGVPADAGLLVLAVDGAFRGLVFDAGEGLRLRAFDDLASRAALRDVWLPGAFSVVIADGPADAVGPTTTAAPKASRLPPWLVGLLPDTRMNLGLDLQGGIDLTLQVELEEAVLSQVSRDLTYLKEQAARDGVTITSARDDRTDPIMTIETPDSLSDLQKWFARAMPDYEYTESPGSGVHVFRMRDQRVAETQEHAVEQVLETLRKRVDGTGVKEPSIVKKGGGRINVQLPGVVDLQSAIDAIGTTAVLEFRLVDMEFDESELQRILTAAQDTLPAEQFAHDPSVNQWLQRTKRLPENRIVMFEYEDTPEGRIRKFPYVLKEVILTGNDVNNAGVAFDQNNLPYVSLEFKPQGSRIFCTVTTENVRKNFAIVLDGEVKSAPSIRERICGGRASIEMGSSLDALKDAETLSLVLRTGSLNAPVSIGEVRTVGSTLGQDAIRSGGIATIIGASLVLVFMFLWYRTAGLLADVSLALNVMMVLACLALFGATLTLPGIAGIALTIGMAVDANIIIYERIREELDLGQHARRAVDTGFDKGLSAVLDANITTAIAGIVLFSYGTGPVKGFAVTLLIGIITTVVSALFVNRTFMELATRSSTARLKI